MLKKSYYPNELNAFCEYDVWNFVEYNEILKNEHETRCDINTLIRY